MRTLALAILLAGLPGCMAPDSGPSSSTSPASDLPLAAMALTSPAFPEGGSIPTRFTCDGASTSLPLNITGVPAEARSVAVVMQDPDVPTPQAPARTLTHWTLYNLTGTTVTVPEGAVPAGARQGANSIGQGYLGPCPPIGSSPHHYNLTAYALDRKVDLPSGASRSEVDAAMAGHVVARARLIGLYERKPV